MIRIFLWCVLWIASLGLVEIYVAYADGLVIELHSWPRVLRDYLAARRRE